MSNEKSQEKEECCFVSKNIHFKKASQNIQLCISFNLSCNSDNGNAAYQIISYFIHIKGSFFGHIITYITKQISSEDSSAFQNSFIR